MRHHRARIDLLKLDHFLSFVDKPYFYQDVAYGTRTLKLDFGDHLVMLNAIRIVEQSTMIEQYLNTGSSKISTPWKIIALKNFESKRGLSKAVPSRARQHCCKRSGRVRSYTQDSRGIG